MTVLNIPNIVVHPNGIGFYILGESLRWNQIPINSIIFWNDKRFLKLFPDGRRGIISKRSTDTYSNVRKHNGCPFTEVDPEYFKWDKELDVKDLHLYILYDSHLLYSQCMFL